MIINIRLIPPHRDLVFGGVNESSHTKLALFGLGICDTLNILQHSFEQCRSNDSQSSRK